MAYYLLHERSFADLEGYDGIAIEEGFWDSLQDRPEYKAKKKADRISYGWDYLINNVHLGGHPNYEKIARELARPNRFDRRYLSQAFYDAHLIANQSAEDRMTFRRVVQFRDATYCFLFTGDAISREKRRKIMEALCLVARGKYQDSKKVVGIATEMKLRSTCSYDFCLLEIEEWTEDHKRKMQKIQDITGLLTNITEYHLEAHEYPETDS